jgi:hypothetical protein
MTIIEEIELVRKDIEFEIGEFKIIDKDYENKKLLLLTKPYYFVAKKQYDNRFFIEDITWMFDKFSPKKKSLRIKIPSK